MSNPVQPCVIVVGVDYSENGELALEQAIELAALRNNAELHAIHVISQIPPPLPIECVVPANLVADSVEEAIRELERHLAEMVTALGERAGSGAKRPRVAAHVRLVMPAHEITRLAADLKADLVVIGTHGRHGVSRLVLGSVAEEVVRLAPCPVLVVRPKRRALHLGV